MPHGQHRQVKRDSKQMKDLEPATLRLVFHRTALEVIKGPRLLKAARREDKKVGRAVQDDDGRIQRSVQKSIVCNS